MIVRQSKIRIFTCGVLRKCKIKCGLSVHDTAVKKYLFTKTRNISNFNNKICITFAYINTEVFKGYIICI